MVAVRIVESILDGDIGTLICALFPFAIATWWIIRVHILPARKWKPPLARQSAPTSTAKRKPWMNIDRPQGTIEERPLDAAACFLGRGGIGRGATAVAGYAVP